MSVCYFPKTKILASCGYDKTIKLWNTENWSEIATLKGHSDWVRKICYCPDKKTLASCDFDKTIILWNTEDYE